MLHRVAAREFGALTAGSSIEKWGGAECTVNRVGNTYRDQLVATGHHYRDSDMALLGQLGLSALRFPVLWERVCPATGDEPDWSWSDARLAQLRELGIRPIVGLLHHGSGPSHTSLVDPLPHQITAVYEAMLPRLPLRMVLADDPGAGKTIMAGLLMKELHLRGVADRILVLCPAPLTVQWKEELHDKFDERFEILDSHQVKWQIGGNPWQEHDRAISSLDFAKRDEVMPDLLLAEWDLVVIDEAHKCAAASYFDAAEQREKLDRTKRYTLAEELSTRTERLLLRHAGEDLLLGRRHRLERAIPMSDNWSLPTICPRRWDFAHREVL